MLKFQIEAFFVLVAVLRYVALDDEVYDQCQSEPGSYEYCIGRCICPFIFEQICGTDNVTYGNECLLKCSQRCGKNVELAYKGKCEAKHNYCPKGYACTKEYNPVCGTNNKTYSNKCLLDYDRKCYHTNVKFDYNGCCEANHNYCCEPRFCPDIYQPVCGTNNKTYSNECFLKIDAECYRKNVKLDYNGSCEANHNYCSEPRFCPFIYQPVCGTNKKTYTNKCFLDIDAECYRNGVKIDYIGMCQPNHNYCPKGCKCTKEYTPVCGTNNKTYSNNCSLCCDAKCYRNGVQFDYNGKCEANHNYCPDGYVCTEEYKPVCGTNNKTYSNECFLSNEAKCYRTGVKYAYDGPCEARHNYCRGGYSCAQIYKPVCGTDKKTYPNECTLDYERKCYHKNVYVLYNGECKTDCFPDCIRKCSTYCYQPVCGTDGKTYSNMCVLKCYKKYENKQLRFAYDGKCEPSCHRE